MSNTIEILGAREAFIDSWDNVIHKLTMDFYEQIQARGHKPEWYMPMEADFIGEGKAQMIIMKWELRPEVIQAMRAIVAGEVPPTDA